VTASRRLFIYFRVRRESQAGVVAAVRELHATWQSVMPGLHCELLQRVDDSVDLTLMETYGCADGVSAAWQERIERDAVGRLANWLVGPRHVEVFEPCA
jgi:Domain of unknown function (DUF4936)